MHCCAVFHTNNFAGIQLYDECMRSNAPNVCHKLLSISLPHEQVGSQTKKKSGLPVRAKKRHVRTFCEQTVDNSPTDQFSSSFEIMITPAWRCDFVQLLCCFIRKSAISFHAFLYMTFHVIGPWWHRRKSLIRTYFCNYPQYPY